MSHPILTCQEALNYERAILGRDKAKVWKVMKQAGQELGQAILQDIHELTPNLQKGSLWVLAGKGHNAGDALLAASAILKQRPQMVAEIFLAAK